MKIINLTPHDIILYDEEDCFLEEGKYTIRDNAAPIAILPSEGVARASQEIQECGYHIPCNGHMIPVRHVVYGEPKDLPAPQKGVCLIVSALTANAAKAASRSIDDLYVPHGTVRNEAGAVIGCTGFSKI